jgi:hypothetical protein
MKSYTDHLNLIAAKLVRIGKDIQGIETAIDPAPINPDTAKLPMLYVFTGQAQYDETSLGENFAQEKRIFRVQVAVIPTSQGNPNTREVKCRPLVEAVVKRYQAYFQFRELEFVLRVKVLSDSGIVVLPEYGYKFIGFEVPIEITSFAERNFDLEE